MRSGPRTIWLIAIRGLVGLELFAGRFDQFPAELAGGFSVEHHCLPAHDRALHIAAEGSADVGTELVPIEQHVATQGERLSKIDKRQIRIESDFDIAFAV